MTLKESLAHFAPVVSRAKKEGLGVRGYVSTVFGCPYEGKVSADQGISVAERLLDLGCDELSIGDTIGVATPGDVERWLVIALKRLPLPRLALHFHDTRGTALANVMVGLQHGVRILTRLPVGSAAALLHQALAAICRPKT